MEYMTRISIPAQDEEFYGMPAGNLMYRGARVQADGKVKGSFKYVKDYITINGKTAGHYFAAWVNVPGSKLEIVRCSDGTSGVGTMGEEPGDNFVVILMDDNKEFDIKVDDRTICHLDFTEAVLEDKKEEKKMNVDFFDTGTCGIALTGHIGTVNKDSKADEKAVVFEKALPVGTKLVSVLAIPTEDMKGATKVTVGSGSTEDAYAKDVALTAGKAVVSDAGYKDITSGTVQIKVDAAISAGAVDVFATVIRLDV